MLMWMGSNMSQQFIEPLPQKHKEALKLVFKALGQDARLSGGTALMLQIGHRCSYDLDFFLSRPLHVPSIEKRLQKVLGLSMKLTHASSDQMNIEWEEVRISLIHFPFLPLYSILELHGIRLTNLGDIASEKAYALGRREEWRDYVDLFALIKGGWVTLRQIMKDAKERFGEAFSARLFLNQLASGEDVPHEPIQWIKESFTPEEVCSFLRSAIKEWRLNHG